MFFFFSCCVYFFFFFFFSSRRRHTRLQGDWSSDVCSSDLERNPEVLRRTARSRWSVPYDELVELRVRAFWWGGASLVARDRSGASRAARIPPSEVAALQRKLDAVEHRLALDSVVL